jgi:phospholipid/cholesterol/gamma-HCH transport system substrate-binding protein
MDLSYKQEVTVGSLVILAIVLFIVGTTWLGGRSVASDSDDWWKIQFKDAGNLKTSSPVKISGVAVGKVERIRLLDPGKVVVEVSLPERITPRVDASAQVVAVGFVGDAAVQLNPGEAPEKLSHDRIIIGSQAAGLTDLAAGLGDKADSVLVGAQAIVNQKTADQLYATMAALQATLKAGQRTMEIYGDAGNGPTAQLTRTLQTLERMTARLDSTFANPGLVGALARSDSLTANLSTMTAQLATTGATLDTLLLRVNQGQGTIGKFATDSGLYNDLRATTQSMKNLLDELQKHPGKVPVTVKIF